MRAFLVASALFRVALGDPLRGCDVDLMDIKWNVSAKAAEEGADIHDWYGNVFTKYAHDKTTNKTECAKSVSLRQGSKICVSKSSLGCGKSFVLDVAEGGVVDITECGNVVLQKVVLGEDSKLTFHNAQSAVIDDVNIGDGGRMEVSKSADLKLDQADVGGDATFSVKDGSIKGLKVEVGKAASLTVKFYEYFTEKKGKGKKAPKVNLDSLEASEGASNLVFEVLNNETEVSFDQLVVTNGASARFKISENKANAGNITIVGAVCEIYLQVFKNPGILSLSPGVQGLGYRCSEVGTSKEKAGDGVSKTASTVGLAGTTVAVFAVGLVVGAGVVALFLMAQRRLKNKKARVPVESNKSEGQTEE